MSKSDDTRNFKYFPEGSAWELGVTGILQIPETRLSSSTTKDRPLSRTSSQRSPSCARDPLDTNSGLTPRHPSGTPVALQDGLGSGSGCPDRRKDVLLACYSFVGLLARTEGPPVRPTRPDGSIDQHGRGPPFDSGRDPATEKRLSSCPRSPRTETDDSAHQPSLRPEARILSDLCARRPSSGSVSTPRKK